MPETPDFDQTARAILEASDGEPGETRIAEQLRLIWNARGAADLADLDHTFSAGVSPSMKVIDQIIRALDR